MIDEFDSNQDGQLDAREISTLVATVEARGQSLLASLVHTGADAQPASSERALLGRVDSVGSTTSTVSLSELSVVGDPAVPSGLQMVPEPEAAEDCTAQYRSQ